MSQSIEAAWAALEALPRPSLSELFVEDERLAKLSARLDLPGGPVIFDWSKTHLDDAHVAAFENLAEAAGFGARRAALFAGEAEHDRAPRGRAHRPTRPR